MTGRDDWYVVFANTLGLSRLNRYVTQASKQITGRHESITSSRVIAELTLGFWVSLLNSEYDVCYGKICVGHFPLCPKKVGKGKMFQLL